MSIVGSPNAWVQTIEDFLPRLLEIALDAWGMIRGPLDDDKENTVTKALSLAIRNHRSRQALPFYVGTQWTELEPAPGEKIGLLDIVFLPSGVSGPPDESIYFCLECKWLNVETGVQKRPGGSEYVKNGMLRFVVGQYAKEVKHGGMVGYVQDGDIPRAIANVEDNIKLHCVTLCMHPPGILEASSILTALPVAKETLHLRTGEKQYFHIHHLFVNANGLLP